MEGEIKKNKNTGLYVIIGILCVMVLALGGYFVYKEYIEKDKDESFPTNDNINKGNTNTTTKDDLVETTLSDDNEIVKSLSAKTLNLYPNSAMPNEYENYFYKKDKVILEDEDLQFRLSVAAERINSDYIKYDSENKVSYIEEETIKEAYFNLFGKNAKYERNKFLINNCAHEYTWSSTNNRYEANQVEGCGGIVFGGSYTKYAYAIEKKNSTTDIIEIYEYYISINPSTGVYSDYKQTNLIKSGEVSSTNEIDEIINTNKDKVGIYKYNFVKDENGTYVFTSVEKYR